MRTQIINAILGLSLGGLLTIMGYGFNTWQYWGCMILVMGLLINNTVD